MDGFVDKLRMNNIFGNMGSDSPKFGAPNLYNPMDEIFNRIPQIISALG